jgi:hypothetical protein
MVTLADASAISALELATCAAFGQIKTPKLVTAMKTAAKKKQQAG